MDVIDLKINCLVAIVRSVGIKRALSAVEPDSALNFWRFINGGMLDLAIIEWCKIFGTDDQDTHWKKQVPEAEHERFRKGMFSYIKISEKEWAKRWKHFTHYRNNFAAHNSTAVAGGKYPELDVVLKSSFYYYSYLRENILNTENIRLPKSLEKYYERFLEQSISISTLAVEATSEVTESVY